MVSAQVSAGAAAGLQRLANSLPSAEQEPSVQAPVVSHEFAPDIRKVLVAKRLWAVGLGVVARLGRSWRCVVPFVFVRLHT